MILGRVLRRCKCRRRTVGGGSLLAGGRARRSRNASDDDLISSTRFGLEEGLVGQCHHLHEVWGLVDDANPKLTVKLGWLPAERRSTIRCMTLSRTWTASGTPHPGSTMTIFSAVTTSDVRRPQGVAQHLRKGAERPVTGVMPEHIVELFEVIEVAVSHRIFDTALLEITHTTFQASSGQQPGKGISVGLGPGDLKGSVAWPDALKPSWPLPRHHVGLILPARANSAAVT